MEPGPVTGARLLAAVAVVVASPVSGMAGPELDDLRALNNELNRARQLLPTEVGGALVAEATAIADIEKITSAAREKLTEKLAVERSAFAAVFDNLTEVEGWLSHLKLSHACNVARQRILEQHHAGRRADEELFAALDAAALALAKGGNPQGQADADFWFAQLDAVRKADAHVGVVVREARDAAATSGYHQLVASANAMLSVLAHRNASLKPVTADAVANLRQAATALREADPTAALFYIDELTHYEIELHWASSGPGAEKAIAAVVGGSIAAQGPARGKALDLRVEAQMGMCYLLVAQFEGYTGSERLDGFTWEMNGRGSALQTFTVHRPPTFKGLAPRGFCTTHRANVTGRAALAGLDKTLRYVLLEIDRAAFPRAFAGRLEIDAVDHCDARAWRELWTDPVPGSLLYREGEPIVVKKVDDDGTVHFWTVGQPTPQQMAFASLTRDVPDAITFHSGLAPAACPTGDGARAPVSRRLVGCGMKVDRKYAGKERKIRILRAAGKTTEADEMAARLAQKQARDRETRCGRIAGKAAKAFQKAHGELTSQLTNARYQDPIDRAALIRSALDARVYASENEKVN